MTAGELLLEVRAEEIPARMLPSAVRHLGGRAFEELMTHGMGPREIETAFTPRRLVLILRGLPAGEPDRVEEVIGPPAKVAWRPDGTPTPALEGFARRLGVETGELERVTTDKGDYVAARRNVQGRPMREVLAELLPRLLLEIPWTKQMRWGKGIGPWVRPVHGIVALYEGEVIPFGLFGIESGATTIGHPVLSPEPFTVASADEYLAELRRRGIAVVPDERRKQLSAEMAKRAEELAGTVVPDDDLLAKLTAICEIPGVLEGSFDARFTDLPREILIASLKDHQSAFTVERDGEMLPHFLTVMDRPNDPAGRVKAGNEWVVDARLADAEFFYREDQRSRLAERAQKLAGLTFHAALGSYAEKAQRIGELAQVICRQLNMDDRQAEALEAAALLKADLATQMVVEFTSLQGQIGGVYARQEGYPEEVWQAIYDQYLPISTEDPIPRGAVGRVVSLADRIDTLVGMFGLGLLPTGSKDPFGLRRAAQGVVRICLEGELPLDLDLVAAKAARLYGDRLVRTGEEILDDLRPFLHDRVRHLLGQAGFAYDEIEAGLAIEASDLPDLARRVAAIHEARAGEGFLSLVLSAKRIVNIVKGAAEHSLKEDALVEPAERDLYHAFVELREQVDQAAVERDYPRGLTKIAELAPVLDRFFDEVLVMDEDERLRHNRIALLQGIHRSISKIARLTEVVVDKSEHRAKFSEVGESKGSA